MTNHIEETNLLDTDYNLYDIDECTAYSGPHGSEDDVPVTDNCKVLDRILGPYVIENNNISDENIGSLPEHRKDNSQSYKKILTKQFDTPEAAENYYREYARSIGFGVRCHNKGWNSRGQLIGRKWVCSRQGWRHQKHLQKMISKWEPRPLTRMGYKAEFQISKNADNNGWVYNSFHPTGGSPGRYGFCNNVV